MPDQTGEVCVLVFGGLAPAEKKIDLFWTAASGPI